MTHRPTAAGGGDTDIAAATASSHLGKLTEAGRTGLVRTFGIQRAHRKADP